jgi:RNA polymerase sigma factor (sigma-70 family)
MTTHRLTPEEAGELVVRVRAGDSTAWPSLVDGFLGLLVSSLRELRLSDSDVRDVTQTTWLRLIQNVDRIEDPRRVGSWLVTTARREGLRIIGQRRWGDLFLDVEDSLLEDSSATDAFTTLMGRERDEAVRTVFDRLPEHSRDLLTLLFQDPRPPYKEISRRLDMPIGSIGPTRARALRKFRELADELGVDLKELAYS